MRVWVLCWSLCVLALPAAALAKCPPNQHCPPPAGATPHAAPQGLQQPPRQYIAPRTATTTGGTPRFTSPTTGQPHVFGSTTNPGAGQPEHRFDTPRTQTRSFGGQPTTGSSMPGGEHSDRRFEATSHAQPRSFGNQPTTHEHFSASQTGPQHFATPAGESRPGERHFGDAGGRAPDHARFATDGSLRHSDSGRSFTYRGHSYQRFAVDRYRYPHGYAYRRYEVGRRLPRIFWFNSPYVIVDYVDYGVDDPPVGFAWVRYGPDLLLVNTFTGEVSDVVPGVFDEDRAPPPDGDAPTDDGGDGPPSADDSAPN